MKISELANRYAKAIFELAVDKKTEERVIAELRELNQAFSKDPEVSNFMASPMVKSTERVELLKKALENKGLSREVYDLLLLLAEKDRFAIFHDIVQAYEAQSDSAHNVCRGTVRSAVPLAQADRERIESTVEKVLKKKVIMTYKVDPSVIGGLIAQVGSYTFDDSIAFHLTRMNEELKRRTV